MDDQNRPAGARWLTWGRAIGLAIFGLALFRPVTRVIALGYGFGWVLVECMRAAQRASKPTDRAETNVDVRTRLADHPCPPGFIR